MTALADPPARNRGRRNSNERGGSKDRRARKLWLLSAAAGFGGDGVQVPCQAPAASGARCGCGRVWPCPYRRTPRGKVSKWHRVAVCGTMVTFATMIVGRIVPGCEGGTYRRDNIRPECAACSTREGQGRTTALRFGGAK